MAAEIVMPLYLRISGGPEVEIGQVDLSVRRDGTVRKMRGHDVAAVLRAAAETFDQVDDEEAQDAAAHG